MVFKMRGGERHKKGEREGGRERGKERERAVKHKLHISLEARVTHSKSATFKLWPQ